MNVLMKLNGSLVLNYKQDVSLKVYSKAKFVYPLQVYRPPVLRFLSIPLNYFR